VKAIVEAELTLNEPSADQGLVTWFRVRVVEELDGEQGAVAVRARVARVHVGMAADVGERLHDVLDADGGELEALYEAFFDEDWFRQQFTEGTGSDLLYLSEIDVEQGWEGRNVELALVRRLCDTLGQGCELAVIPYGSESESDQWQRLGFTVAESERDGEGGYLHLPLGRRQARVVPGDDHRSFRIVPTAPLSH
jgi:hypothetical protein